MNCESARKSFALLLYGELSFDDEEQVQAHLHGSQHASGCPSCLAELDRERRLHTAFDACEPEASDELLRQARSSLHRRLSDRREADSRRRSFWDFLDRKGCAGIRIAFQQAARALRFAVFYLEDIRFAPGYLRPVGALALVALGFFGARFSNLPGLAPFHSAGLLSEPAVSRVRYVEPEASGAVQIVVDETRQRILTGGLNDEHIRRLLLSAAKDPADPGLRVESVDILKAQSQSQDIRAVLLY
ncbi:MAG: hypothetical protein ABI165_15790, partial [Bryobacteraceae bacterium]